MTQQERQALEALEAELQSARTQARYSTDPNVVDLLPTIVRLIIEVGEVLR